MSSDNVLIEISASPARRWMAIICLAMLSILLVSLMFGDTPEIWKLVFGLIAVFVLWCTNQLRESTRDSLVLTETEFRTGSGRLLTTVANVERVERGAFAFKPSNGFLVRLKEPAQSGWAPGLWWLRGRRLGVGGTLSGGQTRAMADSLAALALEHSTTED
ncbi:MAG: hypothetical protein HKN18_16475 [Silicimonas sp.]|nr:hypothetical protein [Silicimonas sp.]